MSLFLGDCYSYGDAACEGDTVMTADGILRASSMRSVKTDAAHGAGLPNLVIASHPNLMPSN